MRESTIRAKSVCFLTDADFVGFNDKDFSIYVVPLGGAVSILGIFRLLHESSVPQRSNTPQPQTSRTVMQKYTKHKRSWLKHNGSVF